MSAGTRPSEAGLSRVASALGVSVPTSLSMFALIPVLYMSPLSLSLFLWPLASFCSSRVYSLESLSPIHLNLPVAVTNDSPPEPPLSDF